MKKTILIAIVVIFVATSFAMTSWSNNSRFISSWSDISTDNIYMDEFSANDDWVSIGETTLSNLYNSSETIKATLYVRELANNLIYRVENKGNFYATRWDDNSKTYQVTIEGKIYRCDVPSVSNGNHNQALPSYSQNKLIGKWRPQENNGILSAMSISESEGKTLVNVKWFSNLYTSIDVQSSINVIRGRFLVSKENGIWTLSYYGGSTCKIKEKDGYSWTTIAEIPWKGYNEKPAELCNEWIYFEGKLNNGILELHLWRTYSYCDRSNWECFKYDCGNYYYKCTTW